ncbi:MAG: hypothetical protein SPK06_00595 [Kiritimatiellia bacterium]|nr:hypothetical protein [Kiritimatiellia bacterium]
MERSESAPTSVLELFSSFDAALVDDSRGVLSLILLKKFKNESGKITLAVFHIAEVGKSIGPLSAHLNGLTRNWLKTKRLVLNEKGEPWNYGRFNSANHPKNTDARAEGITPATGGSIAKGGQDVNQDGEVGEWEVPTGIVECRTQGEEQARFFVGRPYRDAIRFSISPSAQLEYDEVINPKRGEVVLNKKGVKSSVSSPHGGLYRAKAMAFEAVPGVIQKGRIFDSSDNWKGRQTNTFVIAAPVSLGGKAYYCEVVVSDNYDVLRDGSRRSRGNVFYLQNVYLREKEKALRASRTLLGG